MGRGLWDERQPTGGLSVGLWLITLNAHSNTCPVYLGEALLPALACVLARADTHTHAHKAKRRFWMAAWKIRMETEQAYTGTKGNSWDDR